jgi:peptidyl-prolyl cis-trans isomerase C
MNLTSNRLKPLLKILLLGALLAAVVGALRGPPGADNSSPEISVTLAEVAHLQARWQRQWKRPPTLQELQGAVNGYVRNEILYREALDRKLDREDPRVRLALVQKMQLLAAGRADAQEVTDEDLTAFLSLRKEQYRIPARLSVHQVYFKDDGEPGQAQERAEALLEEFRLKEPDEATLAEAGDPTMLARTHLNVTAPELEKQLGAEFAAAVLPLPENTWSGPIPSAYGQHLVKVTDRTPGRLPTLQDVRGKVETDLRYETRKAAEEQGYLEVAGKYRVNISSDAQQLLEGNSP